MILLFSGRLAHFRKALFGLFIFTFVCSLELAAQVESNPLSITVKADRNDWNYQIGEKPTFVVTVLQNGQKPQNLQVHYEIGPERQKAFKKDSVILNESELVLGGYTLEEPGFLRCIVTVQVDGTTVKGLATVAFSPTDIKPTIQMPNDFNDFWQHELQALAKIPMDPQVELLEERSTESVNLYQVNIQNINGSRIYGILCVPKKEGKYPAVLKVPGAGVRPYRGEVSLAEKGFITFQIGIHGIPVDMPPAVYASLAAGALNRYPNYNLDNKHTYYYKRVYLGCIRALDFLVEQEKYDGKNLAVQGGSQGGALAIVTAALDPRIKHLGVFYPALSDLTGYLHMRAGGWPHYFSGAGLFTNNTEAKLETCQYYDVVNFAKQLKVEGFYSWGYNDETCPPTSMYSVYNSITAPKQLAIYKETGHSTIPEQRDDMTNWLISKLKP